MSTRFKKYNIDGVCITLFQISCIHDTTNYSHKYLVRLCHEVQYRWWGNQELELQGWEDFIKSNKTIILDIIMSVPNENTKGYKEHVI